MDGPITYKVVIIGASGVGKSSIMAQFIHQQFYDHYISTIGIDFSVKLINVKIRNATENEDFCIQLKIFDTAGQKRFRSITEYYQNAGVDGVIAVYDVTNTDSFQEIEPLIERARDISELGFSLPVLLVGNKIDLDDKRRVTTEEGESITTRLDIDEFREISAKTSYEQCENVFKTIALQIRDSQLMNVELDDESTIRYTKLSKPISVLSRLLNILLLCSFD